MSVAEDETERVPLPPLVMGVCIAAGVLGVLGVGAGLFQLITSLVSGGFLASSGASLGGELMTMWTMVSMGVGVLIIVTGLLLSLLAAISGFMGVATRRVGALKWVAALLVVFDLLAHLLWPVIGQVVTAGIMFQEMGADSLAFMLPGLVGLIVGLVWSFLLVVFWAAVFFVLMKHGKASADVDLG